MGDRGVIVVKQEDEVAAAAVYVQWSGDRLIELLTAAIPRMRRWDASYSVARLVGVLHESIEGNTGLGLVEPPRDLEPATLEDLSDGDAGVIVYDCGTGLATYHGGYLCEDHGEGPHELGAPPP